MNTVIKKINFKIFVIKSQHPFNRLKNNLLNRLLLTLLLCGCIHSIAFSQIEIPSEPHPKHTKHLGYSVHYDQKHRQAKWVGYLLTKSKTIKVAKRSNKFTADPLIPETDNAKDYKKSGFDRGHLAPAADMSYSQETMQESFYFSNMSPQNPSFNRGIWKKLEEKTRDWAIMYDSIYVNVGPILNDSLPSIGPNKVSVPKYYYKVLLDYRTKHQPKAIGFIFENNNSSLPLEHFAVSIDKIEQLTQLDFFHQLPDHLESKLEKETCVSCWEW